MSAGFWARISRAVLIATAFVVLPVSHSVAGERKAIITEGTDYFGEDLETVKDIDLEGCQKSCVEDSQCKAFTYNLKARWCFKKAEVGDLREFAGATSGKIVEAEDVAVVDPTEQENRRAELQAIVPTEFLDEAASYVGQMGARIVKEDFDVVLNKAVNDAMGGSPATAAEHFKNALRYKTDRLDIWQGLALAASQIVSDDYSIRSNANYDITDAAINAYLLSVKTEDKAMAMRLIATGLANREVWRPAINIGRKALEIEANEAFTATLDQWVAEHGFRITENTVDTSADEPRICAVFSEQIASENPNITDFVSVEGGDKLSVEAESGQICASGVDYGRRYYMTVRQGLPALDPQETLSKTVNLEFYISDRPAELHFIGRAYVLPKGQDAAIPVASVNVDLIRARVVRIGDRSLVNAISDGTFLSQLYSYQLDDIGSRIGAVEWEGTVGVKRNTNREVVTAIPVGEVVKKLKPGVYAMQAIQDNDKEEYYSKATQWFVVTDTGLSTMSANDGLHVVTRSLMSAGPVTGAKLTLIALNNEILGTATTDTNGYARFDAGLINGTGGMAPAVVTAETGGDDFTFIDLTKPAFDLSDRGVEGRTPPQPVDVFMTTDRGVYRPGEQVNITALTRDSKAVATTDLPLTLIVTRPDGVEHLRKLVNDEGAGGRDLTISLPGGAMRGAWRVAAYTDVEGEALAEESFQVEDFQPERIDFTIKTDAVRLAPGEVASAEVNANWLYGAPAANLSIEGEVYVTATDGIDAFPGYHFGIEDEEFTPVAESISGGPTDEDGNAVVDLVTPDTGASTRPQSAAVHIRVLDTNGRPVERKMTLPVSSGAPRVGVKPLFDYEVEENGRARFEVIGIDPDNKKIETKGLEWTLNKVNIQYQWYNSDGSWNYQSVRTTSKIANGTVDVGTDVPAVIEAGVEWGEYEIAINDPAGNLTPATHVFYAGWYVPPSSEETPDQIRVTLDKEKYAIGDTLVAHLEPRFPGVALVSVVDDRLITMKTVDIPEGGADVPLEVTADWGPGAYITATLLRPMDVDAKRMPNRALGLAWATVDPGNRKLDVALTVPAENLPRTALPIEVALNNVQAGEDAYVTVAAIDAGILNLTGFEPPAPEDWYFAQRELGVEFRDIYGQLINSMLGDKGVIRSGGDGSGIAKLFGPPPTERLVAFYQGVTKVGADGKVKVSFNVPDFNGTIRVMAIAWSKTAVGHASTDVLVRDPVVVQAALPNFLQPGDRSRLQLDITHLKGPSGKFQLSVKTAGDLIRIDPALGERSLEIADLGKARALIPLDAVSVGDETITVDLTGPDGVTLTKTLTLGVRANEPAVTRVSDISLKSGGGTLALNADLVSDFVPGTALATVTVGTVAGIDLPGLVHALDKYPYGCTEQITSRALPLVYLDDVVLAAGLTGETPVRDRVGQAIEAVLVNQGTNGSFGLWGPGSEDLWLDAYVTDFLTRAREKGFDVPAVQFDLAVTNLKNRIAYAPDFQSGGEDVAYALYVLARNGRASIGDLRYYADTKLDAFATPLARAQLGAALALYGDQDKADTAFRSAVGFLNDKPDANRYWRVDYGSDLRDGAAIVALATENKVQAVDVNALASELQRMAGSTRYTTTQEQTWMLLAANALISDGRKLKLGINGEDHEGVYTAKFSDKSLGEQSVKVDNLSDFGIDARITVTGAPVTPEPAGGNGISIERKYYLLDGTEVNPSAMPLGERMVVVVSVGVTKETWARLMIDDPLPAGLAIDNPSLVTSADVSNLSWLTLDTSAARVEYRADRFLAALDVQGGRDNISLAYMVRAVAPGSFAAPAAIVTDMYRPEYAARTASDKIEVVGPLQ